MAWRSRSKTADRQAGCMQCLSIRYIQPTTFLSFYLRSHSSAKNLPRSAILYPFTHSHLHRQTTLEFPKQCQKGNRTTNGWRENPSSSLEEVIKGVSAAKLQSGCVARLRLEQAWRACAATIATYLHLPHRLYRLIRFRAVD